jgi:hypothetical protein
MTCHTKKIAAAIAAVTWYLQAEEEQTAGPFAAPAAEQPAAAGPKPWGLNGRQTQMQLRNLMQLRAFGRMG